MGAGGQVTTVAAFGYNGSAGPTGPVLLAPDGNFCGVGDAGSPVIAGNLFRVSTTDAIQYMHTISANADASGSNPSPGLVLGPDGALYGTATAGGAGVVFRITLAGEYGVVHSFTWTDGGAPRARLTLGADGLFYGTLKAAVPRARARSSRWTCRAKSRCCTASPAERPTAHSRSVP
jgi:uncharacterized repeat protein (TIGR03803 family)